MRSMADSSGEITQLLADWTGGDSTALDRLTPLVFEDLRHMAEIHFARERAGHTLQPTALVNEVYLKLLGPRTVKWKNRAQFFGFAAELMRRVLVDHARRKLAGKRGGDAIRIVLDDVLEEPMEENLDLLGLDEALEELAALAPRQSKVIELRFFGGLSVEDVAEVLKVSERTVKRDWRLARIWLFRRLSEGPASVSRTSAGPS